MLNCVLQRSLT